MARLKIGISACFFHPDPQRSHFGKKTLLYYEQSMAHWIMANGGYPVLIPSEKAPLRLPEIVSFLDALILHGGADVAPRSYGEDPISDKWPGDFIRDQYEIAAYKEFRQQGKPVLGVCRGAQIINVAHGGSLYQDINTQNTQAIVHRDADIYDKHFHKIKIEKNGLLDQIYPKYGSATINSVHHQAVKKLGQGLVIEANSEEDSIIEAFRLSESRWGDNKNNFVLGVQWHPEFMYELGHEYLDANLLIRKFFQEIENRRLRKGD